MNHAPDKFSKLIEIPVERLRIGMYVSRLDRPWTETPFFFQGFIVEDDGQLGTLRQLCKTVCVQVSPAEAAALNGVAIRELPAVTLSAPDLLMQLAQDPAKFVSEVPATDALPLRSELSLASETLGEAKRTVGQIFETLRRGGELDVPHLSNVMDSMVESVFRNRDAMSWLVRMKNTDDYLYSHSLSASVWALAFGRHLGLDKDTLRALGTGAMLLDVGKTRLPPELLRKPRKPDAQEWERIRAHVMDGVELLRPTGIDKQVLTMVATHHERLDGSGYPAGLKGEAIPLTGSIAAIVDSYDAMTAARPYATVKSAYDAVRELKRLGGSAFPAQLVELFIQAVGVFPTGTLVELNTGEVGVVIRQNRFRRLRPEVLLILDEQKKLRDEFHVIDLLTCDENTNSKEPALWISRGLERGAFGIDPAEYFL